MNSLKLNFILFILVFLQMSCTNPIHVKRSRLEILLNKEVGKDFLEMYPEPIPDKLTNETVNFKEYIFNKSQPCSWIIKVNKKSNIIESWRFVPPNGCYE